MRHSGLLCRLPDPPRHFVDDHVIVRGIAAQKAAYTNDRMEFFRFRQSARSRGNFESARHAGDLDILAPGAATQKSIECALKQSLRNERIEARNHNGKAPAPGAQFTGKSFGGSLDKSLLVLTLLAVVLRDSVPPR